MQQLAVAAGRAGPGRADTVIGSQKLYNGAGRAQLL